MNAASDYTGAQSLVSTNHNSVERENAGTSERGNAGTSRKCITPLRPRQLSRDRNLELII